jgi:hypothetical protein
MYKYPCEPTPFETMMGAVMMCRKCGHGYKKPADCLLNKNASVDHTKWYS